MARRDHGFTLIELLIGLAIVGLLAGIAVPTYLGFLQRARETALIHYLRSLSKGQELWRAETDSLGFCGDFNELEESGFVPDAVNFVAARRRAPNRAGNAVTTSSRVVKRYRVDLRSTDNPGADSFTYYARAYPEDRSTKVRWFYLDQTGIIRASTGWAGVGSPPIK